MAASSGLRRYWIKFVQPAPVGFTMGCGVTAFTEDDARTLALSHFRQTPPVIASIAGDVDVSKLDANRVIPNMGDCTQRGVWYPNVGIGPFSP